MKRRTTSRTAETVVWLRALGAREADPPMRNPDDLAIEFLGPALRTLRWVPGGWWTAKRVFDTMAPGYYVYETARTKHLDELLRRELGNGLDQLVLIGSGYDSRPYRFADLLASVRTIEIDRPAVLSKKRQRAARAGLDPSVAVHVPVDLAEDPLEVLARTIYDPGGRTLFLCSGVVMYLDERAVGELLGAVCAAGEGSSICFDYVYRSAIQESDRFFGAKRMVKNVRRMGEPYCFTLDHDEVPPFLAGWGCEVISNLNAHALSDYVSNGGPLVQEPPMCEYLGIVHAVPTNPRRST